MAVWEVAPDIGVRLAELRQHLGLTQEAFAVLFGRGWKQVSAWENGHAAPPRSVLARAAMQHGWPVRVFAVGGPRPSEAVNARLGPAAGTSAADVVTRVSDAVRGALVEVMHYGAEGSAVPVAVVLRALRDIEWALTAPDGALVEGAMLPGEGDELPPLTAAEAQEIAEEGEASSGPSVPAAPRVPDRRRATRRSGPRG